MKTLYLVLLIVFTSISANAQNSSSSVLKSIEENNTTLNALREKVKLQKLENRTGIFLANPEVGFNYLWGNGAVLSNRTDISVIQTFDIPTITGMKSRIADSENNLVEWQYKADRMNIMLEAKQYCIDLVYYNALRKELDIRLQHAQSISESYEKRLKDGDANILEYNKAQLNLSTVMRELSRIDVERSALLSQLKRLNGGIDVIFEDSQFTHIQLPINFDDWYVSAEQMNPVLAYIREEIEVSKKRVSLSKAMRLPTFSAGYMSEEEVDQRFQGVSIGVSIPLWENKNRVRQAKAEVRAAESREIDSKQQFYSNLQIQFNRAIGLQATAQDYRKSLLTTNSTDLLKKALDAGEISLLDYMVEIGFYYETVNQALQAEMEYQKAFAELSVYQE